MTFEWTAEYTVLVLIFAMTTAIALALLSLVREQEDDGLSPEPARRAFGALTPGLAGMIPVTAGVRQRIQLDLYMAGHYQPAAFDNFQATRNLLTLIPLFGGLALSLLGPDEYFFWFAGSALAAAALGYALPRVLLTAEAKQRADRLREGLPILMDTVALCLSSGGGILDSLSRSGRAIRRGYPDLSQEVRVVERQAELRSLGHALDQWKARIPLPELASFVFLLSQGERLGADITRGLWELATSYRINGRQHAEAAANRLSFHMLFPTVLCLLPAVAIILVGPSAIEAVREGQKVRDSIREAEERSKEAAKEFLEAQDRVNKGGNLLKPAPPPPPNPEL
ncbi:type II secretion system F family protein [Fimbriiglobus ruber]|uniref:Type II/IV secretion system protein TadC, associated with Flp pilus assembly n=1 Tax=Fimbriiglobus ruber TaxID=1908690 RepID=A0A225DUI4_9BACT|nr:type II secretion system F family protein [Fimbriiglobus ruber]OWK44981.1 Type II/IV secretion system protein TadC, associated with Flp pilus assembly [Fimbriiglobus ruber]